MAYCNIRKEPRRILNGIMLFLGIIFVVSGILKIYSPDQYLPDGSMIVSDGSWILYFFYLLRLLLVFVVSITLLINGIRILKFERRKLAHMLPLIFGASGCIWIVSTILFFTTEGLDFIFLTIFRYISLVILYIPGMLTIFLLYSIIYYFLPKDKSPTHILVLGAGLKDGKRVTPLLAGRLDKAIEVYEKSNKRAKIIVSGGRGSDEEVSEAYAMREYLLENKIDEQSIILEDESKNTYENMTFSKKIMEQQLPTYKCIFVTSNFHVLRGAILARAIGLNAQGVGSKTALYYLPAAFIREYVAIIFRYKKLAVFYVLYVTAFFIIRSYILWNLL